MTFPKSAALLGIALALGACAGTPDRYAVISPAVSESIRIGFRAVEVRDVSLPAYAAADEIAVQDADGKLVTIDSTLWADNPERAVALELSRILAQLSGARVAPEPWPFEAFPDARLDVRFESLVAGSDGQFRAKGQYFVGVSGNRRERSGLFDLAVPYNPAEGARTIAIARGEIIRDLAIQIARQGLR